MSVEGRSIEYTQLGQRGTTVMLIATIHGDESAGTPLLERLIDELSQAPERLGDRRLIIVPRLNPDGLAGAMRENANGVDLNRDYPAQNGRHVRRQPETRALMTLMRRFSPERIISYHQPLSCIDYDGPAEELARRLAQLAALPVRKLGARPGSLGSWAGVDQSIPIVTVELPRGAHRLDADELWRRYGAMTMAAALD